MIGDYPQFFKYARTHNRDEYLRMAYESEPDGKLTPKVFYLPAYYRSLLVRLFVFGGQEVDGSDGGTVVWLRQKTFQNGRPYQEIAYAKQYKSAQEALVAEAACRSEGCLLVSENPMVSCVPLDALEQFRPVFSSRTSVLGFGSTGRKSVQVYEFTGLASRAGATPAGGR